MSRIRTIIPIALSLTIWSCAGTAASSSIPDTVVTSTTASPGSTATSTATTAAPSTAIPPSTTASTTMPFEPWQIEGKMYYFPVQPPSEASYGSAHHDYPATDIFAPVGSTLVAVTDGTVDEAGVVDEWDPAVDDPATRSGLYVSLVGSDGVRYYYSHLEHVDQGIGIGVEVRAGQKIGTVGNTGNARNTSPHVHFGLSHPTYPGDWETRRGEVSPYPYLVAWERGEEMTPDLAGG